MVNNLIIWSLALITIGSALCVILQKNPIVSALFLIGTFFGLGGLYLSLQAPFIAAIQILIYAGAITVLFIFVIMLLNLKKDPERFQTTPFFKLPRLVVLFLLLWILYTFIHLTAFPVAVPHLATKFSVEELSTLLFSKFLFPFELASYLLLIALIGGVVLAKKRKSS